MKYVRIFISALALGIILGLGMLYWFDSSEQTAGVMVCHSNSGGCGEVRGEFQ